MDETPETRAEQDEIAPDELDAEAGELLPEREALSFVSPPGNELDTGPFVAPPGNETDPVYD